MREAFRRLNSNDEPVRLGGWVALVVGTLIEVGFMWTLGTPVEAMVAVVLTTITTRVGGIEWARKHAYAPSTVQQLERPLTTQIDENESENAVNNG